MQVLILKVVSMGTDGTRYELTRIAAELHAEQKLPYADCFAATLAVNRKASVASSDADFAKVEKSVEVLWT
jgi:predicted nucleic acid-binding protein